MSAGRHGIRKSRALSVYFIFIFVFVILTALLLLLLWFKLSSYQKSQDAQKLAAEEAADTGVKSIAEDVSVQAQRGFEMFAAGLDAEWWTQLWTSQRPDDPESRDTVYAYFDSLLRAGEPEYYMDLSYEDDAPVYKIKLGGKDAVRIPMVLKAQQGWQAGEAELLYSGDYSFEEELPEGMELYCDGVQVTASEDEELSHFSYSGMKDLLEQPVVWRRYSVSGLLCEPELSYGNEDAFFFSEEDGQYVALATDVPADLASKGESFFTAYMNYTMSGGAGWKDYRAAKEAAEAGEDVAVPADPVAGRMAACLALIPGDSIASTMLRKAYDSTCYGLAYTNHEYGLSRTGEPLRWAENCVSIDYDYHAFATLNGQRKDYSGSDQVFRVYFLRVGNDWKIWAFSA
ncbi:MAG: hypothetical protein IK115_00600 [Lachnospiraceae bacterium]|nr:hypothetical protein [Lachnospiraceae bacterium]